MYVLFDLPNSCDRDGDPPSRVVDGFFCGGGERPTGKVLLVERGEKLPEGLVVAVPRKQGKLVHEPTLLVAGTLGRLKYRRSENPPRDITSGTHTGIE